MGYTRRKFSALTSIGLVSLAGCVGLGNSGPSSEAQSAARTYNDGIDLYEQALGTRGDAADAWEVEDFNEAENLYNESEQLYESAADRFDDAQNDADGCESVRESASDMSAHCFTSSRAMSAYAQAANQYADGNYDEGDEFFEEAQQADEESGEYPVNPELDPDDLNC